MSCECKDTPAELSKKSKVKKLDELDPHKINSIIFISNNYNNNDIGEQFHWDPFQSDFTSHWNTDSQPKSINVQGVMFITTDYIAERLFF